MQAILLFDGLCVLCNGLVQFLIKRDPEGKFRFASLQSEAGQELLQQFQLSTDEINTVVLICQKNAFTHSDAALMASRILGGPWSLLYAFIIIPRPWRNAVYNWIAARRYRWFGKKESCMVPGPDIRDRFLDL